ncbi:MAG: hypothetical protein WBZ67_01775, partial [Pseudolabrys sp.]
MLAGLRRKGNFVIKQYLNSFGARQTLAVGEKTYAYYSLPAAEKNGLSSVSRLPFSLKVIIENMLRNEDGRSTSKADIEDAANWIQNKGSAEKKIAFWPSEGRRYGDRSRADRDADA